MPSTTASKDWIDRIKDVFGNAAMRPAILQPHAISVIDARIVPGDSVCMSYNLSATVSGTDVPFGYSVTITVKDLGGGLPAETTYRDVLEKLLAEVVMAKLE